MEKSQQRPHGYDMCLLASRVSRAKRLRPDPVEARRGKQPSPSRQERCETVPYVVVPLFFSRVREPACEREPRARVLGGRERGGRGLIHVCVRRRGWARMRRAPPLAGRACRVGCRVTSRCQRAPCTQRVCQLEELPCRSCVCTSHTAMPSEASRGGHHRICAANKQARARGGVALRPSTRTRWRSHR